MRRRIKPDSRQQIRVEPLEQRQLLAVFHPVPGIPDGAPGSLREAISIANTNGHDDEIVLRAGTYTLSLPSTTDNLNSAGDLDLIEVGKSITIRGAGAGLSTIQAAFGRRTTDRVLQVMDNVDAVIEGVTITGGHSRYFPGGGVLNDGNLSLINSAVIANQVTDNSFLYNDGRGAGIHNTGTIMVQNSRISNNQVIPTYGGWSWSSRSHRGQGGGISNFGTATVVNSEVTVNVAGSGGGIYNRSSLKLGGNTITGNLPDNLLNQGGTVTVLGKPTADPDRFTSHEDQVLNVPAPGILQNDTDPNGDALTVILVSAPNNGSVVLRADGSFDYAPYPDFHGRDQFTYKVSDGASESNNATVTIDMLPANDAPVAVDDLYFVAPGETLRTPSLGVLANDLDVDGDQLFARIQNTTASGALELESEGGFLYSPNPGFQGTDSFTYLTNDGQDSSNVATVTIRVKSLIVTTTADEDDGILGGGSGISLREAIRYAPAGSVIELPVGHYSLSRRGAEEDGGATGDLDLTRDVTLRGAGAGSTVIDAAPLGIDLSNGLLSGDRAIHVLPGVSAALEGVTITGGRPDASSISLNGGGAILNEGEMTLSNSVLRNNHTVGFASLVTSHGVVLTQLSGGAIHNTGVLTVEGSTITENSVLERRRHCFGGFGTQCLLGETVGGEGGGIWNSGAVTLIDSSVVNNEAHNGGGVRNSGSLIANDVTLSHNEAVDFGGAIHSISTATDTLTRVKVDGNSALYGGGINTHGAITIVDSTLSNNSAIPGLGASDGGGLLVQGGGSATVIGSTVHGNTADLGGGIHVYSGGSLRMINSTVSGNSAVFHGGGVLNRFSGAVTLTNVTITANSANAGGGLYIAYDPIVVHNSSVAGNTNISGSRPDDINGAVIARFSLVQSVRNTRFLNASEMIIDPSSANNLTQVDPQLGPLQDNGGATLTHALLSTSPAIDAGSHSLAVNSDGRWLEHDQRGFNRIVANGGAPGRTIDIGAYEAAPIQRTLTPEDHPSSVSKRSDKIAVRKPSVFMHGPRSWQSPDIYPSLESKKSKKGLAVDFAIAQLRFNPFGW